VATTRFHIDHLAFPSFGAAETHRFYTEVLGLHLKFAASGTSREWGDRRYLMMAFGGRGLEIHFFELEGVKRPKSDGLPKDMRHVALSIRSHEKVAAWQRRLESHGVDYWTEDHGGEPSVYFSDPNGHILEINGHVTELEAGDAEGALAVVRRWDTRSRRARAK